jgi:hypothetical protein
MFRPECFGNCERGHANMNRHDCSSRFRILAICGVYPLLLLFFVRGGYAADEAVPQSGEAVRAAFQNPPADCRPLIIMHSGALHAKDLKTWLAARHAGGVVLDAGVQPGSKDLGGEPWNNPTYLNDAGQFEKLRDTVRRLRDDGLHVWLYDELGYPSASAGGRVLEGHPEFQVEVVGCRQLRAAAGAGLDVNPELGKVESCCALRTHEGVADLTSRVDLTDRARAGRFTWQVPEGDWTVFLCERFQPETWRRHNIPRRNVNILDRGAIERFIELTHVRYGVELGTQMRQIDAFFTDEPQFGSAEHWGGGLPSNVPMVQWCDELPVAFRQRTGEDLNVLLPALFAPVGPATAKYRYQFYDVQSDLVANNFFGQIEQRCRELGVPSSGHMLLEESLLFHLMFSGSMLKNWAHMDLPGVDLLGANPYHTMAGWNGDFVSVPEDYANKLASSIAHLAQKKGTFTESFALGELANVRQVKGVTAWQYAGGITHMSTYSIQQSLSAEDYAAFADFAGRLGCLARRGRHVADVAVFVPERSVWASYTPPDGGGFLRYMQCNPQPMEIDRVFRDTCHTLLRHQRDFDCLGEDLLTQATIAEGRLQLADESFSVLVMPEVRMCTAAVMQKVQDFASAGGKVVFIGSLPSQSPESGDDARITEACRALVRMHPEHVAHVVDSRQLDSVVTWIDESEPRRVRWSGPAEVRLLQRQEPGRDIVLIANPSTQAARGQVTVPGAGQASVWNPETGTVESVGPVGTGDAVSLEIPGESARVVVVDS